MDGRPDDLSKLRKNGVPVVGEDIVRNMIERFQKDVARRRAEKIRFFFRAVGMHIRKRRKTLKLTQEELAQGICSNTYVSKMETNSIAVNEESLHLVMERMDMEYSLEMNVDEQIRLFDRALDCYLKGDYEGIARVNYEVRNVEFAILTDLCRMIGDIVDGEPNNIERTSDNLSRYLDSMDHYTFGVFMFFAAAGMIAVGRPADAIEILEELETTEYAYAKLTPMIEYLKAVGYGRTERYGKAYDALRVAEAAFARTQNYRRIAELGVYRLEFEVAQGCAIPETESQGLALLLDSAFADRYRLLRAVGGIDPLGETDKIAPDSRLYAAACFVRGRHFLARSDRDGYRKCLETLRQTKTPSARLDFAGWLEALGDGDAVVYKDFLIAEVLPYAEETTNLALMRRATDTIAAVLMKRKRYKDALQYKYRLDRFVRKMSKTTGEAVPETEPEEEPDRDSVPE